MKKSFIGLAIIAIVAGFASCNKSSVSFSESDLHGKWQEEDKNAYMKFLVEKDTTTTMKERGYHWGYEWDEGDGVYEKDVLNEKYGNGWFLYVLEGDQFTQYHKMSNDGAYIPKEYTITALTNTDLKFKDNNANVNHSYKKAN